MQRDGIASASADCFAVPLGLEIFQEGELAKANVPQQMSIKLAKLSQNAPPPDCRLASSDHRHLYVSGSKSLPAKRMAKIVRQRTDYFGLCTSIDLRYLFPRRRGPFVARLTVKLGVGRYSFAGPQISDVL